MFNFAELQSRRTLRHTLDNFLFFSINCIIKLLGFKKEIMKKGNCEQPRITIYEVETTAILAGSGEVPSEKSGFNLDRESEELTSGDGDDVWE